MREYNGRLLKNCQYCPKARFNKITKEGSCRNFKPLRTIPDYPETPDWCNLHEVCDD